MKERQARNTVDVIYTAVGVKLTNPIDIQAEFKLFQSKLMGSCADNLQGVDLIVIRSGPTLKPATGRALIMSVTLLEIDQAMFSIDGDKAPGFDGFNAVFFKSTYMEYYKSWYLHCYY